MKWYNKVGYGSGDVAGNVVYVLLSAFVMIYLTDTAGLNAGVVGTLMMVHAWDSTAATGRTAVLIHVSCNHLFGDVIAQLDEPAESRELQEEPKALMVKEYPLREGKITDNKGRVFEIKKSLDKTYIRRI